MPRNGSGVFSLDPGYLATTGGTIVISQHNPVLEDIGTEITGSLPTNGSKGMAANFTMTNNRIMNLGTPTATLDAISAKEVLDGGVVFAADSGAADAYVVTLAPVPSAYVTGMRIWFSTANANTGASTIDVNSLGAKSIVKAVSTALEVGDIPANKIVDIIYDGTNFVMQNPAAASLSAATTTDMLTGTDATKYATSDAVAALWERGSDTASASNLVLGEGGYFQITGTTNITDIDFATAALGRQATLRFSDVLTISNGVDLILPGGQDITTAADDVMHIREIGGGGRILCTNYQRAADGPDAVKGQWTESYDTTRTAIVVGSVITLDDTVPTSSEGQEISNIASVVVASGQQVEINYEASIFDTGDNAFVLTLFRDTTCIDTCCMTNSTVVEAPFKTTTTFIDDDPGAATYTYSVRVAYINTGASTAHLNASNATTRAFGGLSRSGLKLRVLS